MTSEQVLKAMSEYCQAECRVKELSDARARLNRELEQATEKRDKLKKAAMEVPVGSVVVIGSTVLKRTGHVLEIDHNAIIARIEPIPGQTVRHREDK